MTQQQEPTDAVLAWANDRDVYAAADAAQRLAREVERLNSATEARRVWQAVAEQERDEARADNAALIERIGHEGSCSLLFDDGDDLLCDCIQSINHPGAELLAEVHALRIDNGKLWERIERLQAVARGTKGLDATYREWAEDDEESFTVLPDRLDADWVIVGDALDNLQPGDLGGEA